MATKIQEVTINRKRKYEAEQAIRDLEARGFEVVGELINRKHDRKVFAATENKRMEFQGATSWDSWHCRLRRVVNDG